MSLLDTPRANRLHIGIYGKVNSGKSTLLNALTNQDVSIVSSKEGTTTDPIYKAMEIHGIGPVVFIDTAGFNDETDLGQKRLDKTKEAVDKTDIALVVVSDENVEEEITWIQNFKKSNTAVLVVVNDKHVCDAMTIKQTILDNVDVDIVIVDALQKTNLSSIKNMIIRNLPEDYETVSITGVLCDEKDVVLLVMPQDIQAPKGRLILPQVQTIRDLLDKKCLVLSCTTDCFADMLAVLKEPPKLIICDSQVFKTVYDNKPKESKLTSFSTLFAAHKGDIHEYVKGANAIGSLCPTSKVLIAEACTHAPLAEDIGREKIPRMLRKRYGESIEVDIAAGNNWPEDLTKYDLIIHCGACMFNRKYVLSRIEKAKQQNVPITNYGVCIAYLTNILDKIEY